ncbi:AraC family transcriptional regulator [Paenibacillus chitinolyticus]|uniref:AraC family transcriptional regulator n=1 Tax=Paenibacillus chitinolyticus TaxID=79263 RepID=UPI001C46FD9A|nr:AraC family transcriptional regulator [Paenibacillus chitinolyticus]MBV6713385.1 AraC family transcriptional regulator [Paenibacillus chitinolyticus]
MKPSKSAARIEGRGERAAATRPYLTDIRVYMDSHYHEQLTVRQLAERVHVSPKYFVDLFKKTFGQSAMDYLTDLRINRAKRYLSEPEPLLLREIAQRVGYKDEYYFSRKFKKEVGMSPTEFARSSKHRIAAWSPDMTGYLIALGLTPLAAPLDPKWTAHYYYSYRKKIRYALKLTDPYITGTFEENADLMARLRPDAVVAGDGLSDVQQDTIRKIAPALFVPTSRELGWREYLRLVAVFLKRTDEAEQWIRGYDKLADEARIQSEEALGDDRILIVRLYGKGLYSYTNRGMEDVLFKDLNLRQVSPGKQSSPIRPEDIKALDPSRILVLVCPESESRAYWLALQHSPEWKTIGAVRSGSIYPISADPWLEYSPVAVARMLDEAMLLFTGKCPNAFLDHVHGGSPPADL